MTTENLISVIKTRLGYPAIDLEVSDSQIQSCIEAAVLLASDHMNVRKYKTYTLDRTLNVVVIPSPSYKVDLSDLDFIAVTEVYRADAMTPYLYDQFYLVNYASRGVAASLATAINIRSQMDALINRSWRVVDKTLFLDKYYTAVTVEYLPKVIALEEIDDSYWVSWIQRYSIALAKETLGRIRGKFVVDSNPFKTDADSLLSESSAEQKDLLTEIENRGVIPYMR